MKLEERIVYSVQLLGFGLDDLGFDSQQGHRMFLQTIQTGCGAHQTFCLFNMYQSSFPWGGGEWLSLEVDQSYPSNPEIKKK